MDFWSAKGQKRGNKSLKGAAASVEKNWLFNGLFGYLWVMLPKGQRVKKALFTKVFRLGRVFSSPYLNLRVTETPKETSRFSFVVSKAVAKSAAKRNLLRRRGYSVIREMKELSPKESISIFFLKKGAEKLSYRNFSEEIRGLIAKTGMGTRKK